MGIKDGVKGTKGGGDRNKGEGMGAEKGENDED